MVPNPHELLDIAGITTPLIGFYDVPDIKPFEPFSKPKRCFFSSYADWLKGYSTSVTAGESSCRGGGYWVGGVEFASREDFAHGLNNREGFKSTDRLMCEWLENLKPYMIRNGHVVIGPLKDDHYEDLKTITFYVNPDQLSLLIHGAEYNNASIENHPVITAFGSGCGQMAALLGDLKTGVPRAAIGATDMAMREHLPPDILAFTVNKPMYKQLCELDESSFLYKHFWNRLMKSRKTLQ
ncbi:MAG: DUF169 domain-containing protein [Bacteroidales bacterium]|nr:DUF169 domain-containing protein [Bacteroidales bacterium]